MPADDETRAVLDARYGVARTLRTRRRQRVLLVVLAVLAALAFGYFAVVSTDEPINTRDVAFRVLDDTAAEVTFAVYQDAGQVAVCRVIVLNATFAQVGVSDVTVGPVDEDATVVTERVATTERAAGARLGGCRPAGKG